MPAGPTAGDKGRPRGFVLTTRGQGMAPWLRPHCLGTGDSPVASSSPPGDRGQPHGFILTTRGQGTALQLQLAAAMGMLMEHLHLQPP